MHEKSELEEIQELKLRVLMLEALVLGFLQSIETYHPELNDSLQGCRNHVKNVISVMEAAKQSKVN